MKNTLEQLVDQKIITLRKQKEVLPGLKMTLKE
jgi:hypothetical protein